MLRIRILYTFFFYLALPLIFLRLLWCSRSIVAYRQRWLERLGVFHCPKRWQGGIWIHAASVGEVIAAIPLIKSLQKQNLGLAVVMTSMTITGSECIKTSLGERVFHVYVPYDIPAIIKRFLRHTQVRALIILETELWPNILHVCHHRGLPIMLANARLSERSVRRYSQIGNLARYMLANIDIIAAQAIADAKRLKQLGALADRVHVTGNVKFAIDIPASVLEQAQMIRQLWGVQRLVWVVASTHQGEEAKILEAFAYILCQQPDTLLVLVPRYPERFKTVNQLCQKLGYSTITRSSGKPCTHVTQVFLGDTMGELKLFYAAADVAFVGGSLMPIGGHNVLEPIIANTATIVGPYMSNFADITARLLEAQGLKQVQDSNELATTTLELLQSSQLRSQLCQRGQYVIDKNRLALSKQVDLAQRMIDKL